MSNKALGALLCVCCLFLASCSESKTHGVIQGAVTLDGEPLQEGTVRFVPLDGESQTASAVITDGEFEATVPIGEARIQISAPKRIGKQKMYETEDSPTVDVVGELIPERYNTRSELELQVEPGQVSYEVDLKTE